MSGHIPKQFLSSVLPGKAPFNLELLGLFDHLPEAMAWIKDEGHRFHWANRSFVLHLGLQSAVQMVGRTDFDFFNAALANQHRFDDEKVLSGEQVIARIELVGLFEHTARWCVTSKIPLHNRRGRIIGTAGVTYPLKDKEIAMAHVPLGPAMHFISEHYGESIDNSKLAKACGLSVRSFERHFRAMYQTSPHDYIRQMRVRMSCNALVYSAKTLSELATEFGFSDQSHFAKEFRHYFGETPSAYRRRYSQAGKRRG